MQVAPETDYAYMEGLAIRAGLGLGDRARGGEGGAVGGGGRGINESYVMDRWKDNDEISIA